MQLTFFIGQKIKCPGRSIYLNHASVFAACLSESSPWCRSNQSWWKRQTEETISDSNPPHPRAWVLSPAWGVDGESDAANSCWGSILGLRSLLPQPRVEYMDPDNIPDQSKVACVCSRITSPACPARREVPRSSLALYVQQGTIRYLTRKTMLIFNLSVSPVLTELGALQKFEASKEKRSHRKIIHPYCAFLCCPRKTVVNHCSLRNMGNMVINLGRKTYNVAAFGYKYEYPWVANCS